MNKQLPSIGRIVHYQSLGDPSGLYSPCPRAAIVTEVHNAEAGDISVMVCNPNGTLFVRVAYSEQQKPGCWNWPPFVPPTMATSASGVGTSTK